MNDFKFSEKRGKKSNSYEPPRDKTNKVSMRPAKTQISLCIRPVWSESSMCPQRVAEGPSFLHTNSEDSDQTGRLPRLIWVFAGRTVIVLVLSWGGSLCLLYWIAVTIHMKLRTQVKQSAGDDSHEDHSNTQALTSFFKLTLTYFTAKSNLLLDAFLWDIRIH